MAGSDYQYIFMKILCMRSVFILISILITQHIAAQSYNSRIATEADKLESKCIEWRRHIHQNPELSNREFQTAKLVANHLRSLGIEVKEGVGKTGVVGILRGSRPGKCVALRADMDALPVLEKTGLPFASVVRSLYNNDTVPVMHACGHDAHVAMLMTAATILSGMKNEIKGTVKFIFQPAEEGPPEGEEGGAPLMIKEGVMEDPKVDAIFGMHIESIVENGVVEFKPGAFMAASDWFEITVKGKGSHGSQPWLGIDPIAVATQIIQGLQQIVSRHSDLTTAPVVISVGKIEGGVRNNIIPDQCRLLGTIRTLDSRMQKETHEKIRKVAQQIAQSAGATADVVIDTKTLVTYNDPTLVDKMIPSLISAAGQQNVKAGRWRTGAEDFSFFGEKAPAFYFYLGAMKKGISPSEAPPHHTSEFFIEESSMKTGVKLYCQLALDYLNLAK